MKQNLIAAIFALAPLFLAPKALAADEPSAPSTADTLGSPGAAPRRPWYGAQILIPSAVFDIAALTTIGGDLSGLHIALFAGRSVTGAVVHSIHGNWGMAFGSLAIHALPMTLATLLSLNMATCDDGHAPCIIRNVIGAGLVAPFAIGATAIDAGALAFEAPKPPSADHAGFSVVPYLAPIVVKNERTGKSGPFLTLGLAGQF